jgi:penicillin-binding protein 2
LDPNSGRVLALASSPSFDQNIFVDGLSADAWKALVENPEHPMENKAIRGQYPPASTFKIITAIAGLEDGVVDETTTFHCPGYYTFGDRTFRCWKQGGHGKVDIVRAIAESCDVYFYQVGQKVGVDRIAYWARVYGLGQPTGIAIGQENRGLVPTSEWKLRRFGIPWLQGETLSIAIGQGYNLVTPLQMAVLVAAVGNGGTRYRPLILDTIKTAEGVTVHQEAPVVAGTVTIAPETLELVRRGLFEVVQARHGTAYWTRLKKFQISGKTGTAQLVSRATGDEQAEEDGEAPIKDHAWFVAYAPSEAPRIAVSVIVEHGEHGSSAAAPIARDMIRAYLENQ